MILEDATFEAFGYYPSTLKPQSNKPNLAACELCGEIKITSKNGYRCFCRVCIQKLHPSKKGKNSPMFGRHGEKAANWQGGPIEGICKTCGKKIYVSKSNKEAGRGKYCCKECYTEDQKGKNTGENNPNYQGGRIKYICEICGKEFKVWSYLKKQGYGKYCSQKCYGRALEDLQKGKNHPNWRGGVSFEPYCVKFNKAFKNYIRTKFGNKCFLCEKSTKTNGRKLDVHHVNYNKDCGCDGDLTCQFVPLCRRCHTKTNTKRDYWKKKIMCKLHNSIIGWNV